MFILKISNYCDKKDSQLCTYEIIDKSNNTIHKDRTEYKSCFQKYLSNYFLKNIQIISGKGSINSTAEIEFKVA